MLCIQLARGVSDASMTIVSGRIPVRLRYTLSLQVG
jgi:hypothetical protein